MLQLITKLRMALLAQVCCGQEDLCEFLDGELDFVYSCIDDACNDQIRYLRAQLGLIELAQIFARNQIDTNTRLGQFVLKETFTADDSRRTDSENTATGRACRWAASTSSQNFTRTSTDDTVAFSEHNSHRFATKLETGFDNSFRLTVGHGFHFSRVTHTINASENGNDLTLSNRLTNASGGTGPLQSVGPTIGSRVTFDPSISLTDVSIDVGFSDPSGFHDIPEPSAFFFPCLIADGNIRCNPVPSEGYGYQTTVRINVTLPTLGTTSAEWSEGKNERQYFSCSSSSTDGRTTRIADETATSEGEVRAFPSENRTSSRETSTIIHLVRKTGISTRRGTETVDAEERSIGRADGNSHSESDRNSVGQAYQQGRSESKTKRHYESHLKHNEDQFEDLTIRRFGQISDHLSQLWNRVFERVTILERQLGARPAGCRMRCNCSRVSCHKCFGGLDAKLSIYSHS